MEKLSIFVSLILVYLQFSSVVFSASFTVTNNCDYTVWPGILSNAGTSPLSRTGFALQTRESKVLSVPSSWSGRLWARTHCSIDSSEKFSCLTGDCGSGNIECSGGGALPPVTLAEFTLNGSGGLDFYDVSLVDGFNLPMLVVAQGGRGNCSTTGCLVNLNERCPSDLQVVSPSDSMTIACKSSCEAFGDPKYCCSGEYGNPNTCSPSLYSKFFKNACPRAYSYAYDDSTSTFTCNSADYAITFCPTIPRQKASQDQNSRGVSLPLINDTLVFLGETADGSMRPRTWLLLAATLTILVSSFHVEKLL